MLSEEESQDELAVVADYTTKIATTNLWDTVDQFATKQASLTNTWWKKMYQFVRIQVLGQHNDFEDYVMAKESNDSSLIAKYSKTTRIDLSHQTSVSVDELYLQTLHIPHPLVNFLRNEAHQAEPGIQEELAESPILVFIHGLGGQMSQFEPLMGLLSQCLEIIALDLPGFGNSKANFTSAGKYLTEISPEDQLKISSSINKMQWDDFQNENIVNIVYEFIQQQVPENKKIVLIGHSMGTNLSIKVARKLPKHKVEGLTLLSPPPLIDDVSPEAIEKPPRRLSPLYMLKVFSYLPFLFNSFRVWDRLEGLTSESAIRNLTPTSNIYNKLRQFRWNLDVDSVIVLKYASGFKKAKYSELLEAISKFNDNPSDKTVYEKTLLLGGVEDRPTPVQVIEDIDTFLTSHFNRKVSSHIKINNAGHSLLLAKPEFISGMILNHLELKFPERLHLSPAWVLRVKADISGDKWGLKNELKWLQLKPISFNITRKGGKDISPLLGMKTLREGDANHSPAVLESQFYDDNVISTIKGKLIAIVDISADIPPYSPKSFKHVKYYKCATVSKVVPDQVAIRRFIQLIDDILSSNVEENPLIAVHCHYGFNRTGFLICCYLIERLNWSVQEAVEGFRVAKPPGIKHPHFIDALYVRYDNN